MNDEAARIAVPRPEVPPGLNDRAADIWQPLLALAETAAGVQGLRDEYTRTVEPARHLASEALQLERTLSDLLNQAYALTPAEIDLMWKTAPPRMPSPPPTS